MYLLWCSFRKIFRARKICGEGKKKTINNNYACQEYLEVLNKKVPKTTFSVAVAEPSVNPLTPGRDNSPGIRQKSISGGI